MVSDSLEPPAGWEIPELYLRRKYDVGLHNRVSQTILFWCLDVDMVRATEATTELFIMKEKEPNEFQGDIVIRPSTPAVAIDYHGGKCEEDGDDGRPRGKLHLQSVGRDQPDSSHCDESSGKVDEATQIDYLNPMLD